MAVIARTEALIAGLGVDEAVRRAEAYVRAHGCAARFCRLVASYIPARRATKVDPMMALRYE